jgi:hypothetical protein
MMKKALITGVAATGLIAPVQGKPLFVPSRPAIIRPAELVREPIMPLLAMPVSFGILAAARAGVSVSFVGSDNSVASSSTLTYTAEPIGTAASDRLVVVGISLRGGTASSATIGGSAAGLVASSAVSQQSAAIAYLVVTSGTTATIVVNCSASCLGLIGVWAVYLGAASSTPSSSATNTNAGSSVSLTTVTIPTKGAGLFAFSSINDENTTWTNATEDYDTQLNTGTRHGSGAHTTTAGTPTVTAAGTASVATAIAGAAWG